MRVSFAVKRDTITALMTHKDERHKMLDKTIDSARALLGKSQFQAAERSARYVQQEIYKDIAVVSRM